MITSEPFPSPPSDTADCDHPGAEIGLAVGGNHDPFGINHMIPNGPWRYGTGLA